MLRTRRRIALTLAPLALFAACSTPPRSDGARDGPPAQPPSDLMMRPDPQPQVEPIRSGGPNKPYEVLGRRYTPLAADLPLAETGLASWYGRKFHGRPTASGETYDMYATTAAHRTMPLPSYALVRNPANGREIVVRVNDRGPFHPERVIDLSYTAALKLDLLRGTAPVEVRRLTHDDIRSARWRDGTAANTVAAAAADTRGAPQAAAATVAPSAAQPAEAAAAADAAAASAAQASSPGGSVVPPLVATATETATESAIETTVVTPVVPPAALGQALPTGGSFWVQLGAFSQRQGAHELRAQLAQQLDWLDPLLAIFDERALYRLQAGPFESRRQARDMAERIRDASQGLMQPLVLQRR